MKTKKGFSSGVTIGIVVVVITIAGLTYFNTRSSTQTDVVENVVKDEEDAVSNEGEVVEESEDKNEGEVMVEKSSGTFEEYSPEKVSQADGKVILFFHAKWCPTCKSLETNILKDKNSIPSDVTILKTDYDTYTELRQKYGVTVQHTLVQVDTNGNLITKWIGSPSLNDIISKIN